MKKVKLDKFYNNKNVETIKFHTLEEASNFIWNELKGLKKYNFSYSTKKNGWGETITYFKLKDININYIIKKRRSLLKKNIFKIGDELELKNYSY